MAGREPFDPPSDTQMLNFWFVVGKKNYTVIVESCPLTASPTALLWSTCAQASVKVD